MISRTGTRSSSPLTTSSASRVSWHARAVPGPCRHTRAPSPRLRLRCVPHDFPHGHALLLAADDVVRLASDPSAALPSSVSSSALVSLPDSPSVPLTAYLSSLLSLLSRSTPRPSLLSSLSSLLLSSFRLFLSHRLPRGPDTTRVFQLFSPLLPNLDPSHLPSLLDLIASHLCDIADPDDAQAQPLDLLPRLLDLAIDASGEESVVRFIGQFYWPVLLAGPVRAVLLAMSLVEESVVRFIGRF